MYIYPLCDVCRDYISRGAPSRHRTKHVGSLSRNNTLVDRRYNVGTPSKLLQITRHTHACMHVRVFPAWVTHACVWRDRNITVAPCAFFLVAFLPYLVFPFFSHFFNSQHFYAFAPSFNLPREYADFSVATLTKGDARDLSTAMTKIEVLSLEAALSVVKDIVSR